MRPRKQPKEGQLAEFAGVTAREDGKFTQGMGSAIKTAINVVISKLNGRLTFGDGLQGSWTGNLDGYVTDVKFPAVANTEMVVLHELGRVPRFVWPTLKDRAGDVYVSNYSGWGSQAIYLKSNVADLSATLLLF